MMNFDPITSSQVFALHRHFELLHGSAAVTEFLFDAQITGVTLEAWLQIAANDAAFRKLLATYIGPQALVVNSTAWSAVNSSTTAMAAVVSSPTAMAAVEASQTAMLAVIANPSSIAAVIASPTAMTVVAASPIGMAAVASSAAAMAAVTSNPVAMAIVVSSLIAMTALAASPTALMALHASDAALNAIRGDREAIGILRKATRYISTAGLIINGTVQLPGFVSVGTYILLGLSSTNASSVIPITINTRRTGSAIPNTGLTVPSASADAARIDLMLPLVGPFTATAASGYAWYFGAIRCDA